MPTPLLIYMASPDSSPTKSNQPEGESGKPTIWSVVDKFDRESVTALLRRIAPARSVSKTKRKSKG